MPHIIEGITSATDSIELILSGKIKEAMNLFNKKVR